MTVYLLMFIDHGLVVYRWWIYVDCWMTSMDWCWTMSSVASGVAVSIKVGGFRRPPLSKCPPKIELAILSV